jgi:osmoprotectant transport system permease protein
MEFLGDVVGWLTDPANWSGSDGVPTRLAEHLVLSFIPLLIAIAFALPAGLWVGHTGRGAGFVINLANVGRAIPSLAILVMAFMLLGPLLVTLGLRREVGEAATAIAMIALALPPIVTNAYIGLSEVDRELVEAGRGMGMRESQVLMRVELPVALPVILAGIRISAVQVVSTATLGAVVATGGFGRYLIDGIAQRNHAEVFSGALLVATLAILTDLTFGIAQRRAISPGIRQPHAAEPGDRATLELAEASVEASDS